METNLLIANIKRFVPLTVVEENEILSAITPRQFTRGQYISKEGEINRFTNFITSGSAREYYVDGNGQEHVVQLGIRDWWISDFSSFIMQQPGLLYCQALEPTNFLAFSYNDLHTLFDKIPAMERFYRILIQNAYAAFQKRVLQSLSMDAEERYLAFKDNYPLMDQQISQKDIASYLGMSAEFLSKVKKRLALKVRQ